MKDKIIQIEKSNSGNFFALTESGQILLMKYNYFRDAMGRIDDEKTERFWEIWAESPKMKGGGK